MLTGYDLRRYIRHIDLPDFNEEGQEKVKNSKILICGVGGLGNIIAALLSASGVGVIGLIDDDTVDLSNLQRQVFYREKDINKHKVDVLAKNLKQLSPRTKFKKHKFFLNKENAHRIIQQYDLIVDGTDNFDVRYAINKACIDLQKTYIFGSVYNYSGQVAVFKGYQKENPCYECLVPQNVSSSSLAPKCTEAGVLGPLVSMISSFQASCVLEEIIRPVESSTKVHLFDMKNYKFSDFIVEKRIGCPICS